MNSTMQHKDMTDTENNTSKTNLFRRPLWVSVFALTAAVVWGWAYPLIKLGFQEFHITAEMTGSKMLFAGIRFLVSGLIILALAGRSHMSFSVRHTRDWWYVLLFALLNTTLHYTFFYIGLSHSEGARAAILNSFSVFSVVILACLFFRSDRMTRSKLLGCLLGFAGILTLNLDSLTGGGRFSWMGDGMILLNALCGASASLLTRGLSKRVDVFVGTGFGLAFGGAMLILPALIMHGTLPRVTPYGLLILLLLIGISTIGFALYNKLLSCNPVGKVTIYNSLIPVVGAVTSCICLSEPFYWKYILAGALATAGIYIINRGKA